MTDRPEKTPGSDDGKFRIDFIDPLFAVAIHIGLVEGLMREHWLEHRQYPESISDFANLFMFLAGIWTIAASWVGYHRSVQVRRIQGDARFILDIVLLALYIFLLIYFRAPFAIAILMASVYAVYIAWDYFKTVEYPQDFYENAPSAGSILVPNGLTYLWRCLIEWLSPTAGGKLRSGAVTVGWSLVFLLLVPLSAWTWVSTDVGKIAFSLVLVLANLSYRSDKHTGGALICSGTAKVLMIVALLAGLVGLLSRFSGVLCL